MAARPIDDRHLRFAIVALRRSELEAEVRECQLDQDLLVAIPLS